MEAKPHTTDTGSHSRGNRQLSGRPNAAPERVVPDGRWSIFANNREKAERPRPLGSFLSEPGP